MLKSFWENVLIDGAVELGRGTAAYVINPVPENQSQRDTHPQPHNNGKKVT